MSKDICYTSLDFLKKRCSPLVTSALNSSELGSDCTWFPDLNASVPTGEIVNCVLTGNFIKRLLESDRWPAVDYRFWVLSERTKDVLVNLALFEKEEVEVFPRNSIVPFSKENRELNLGQKINFIVSGRVSPTKNIESIILTTFYLQKKFKMDCQLHIVGRSDNLVHPDRGRVSTEDYSSKILQLSASLDWIQPVIFYEEMNEIQWLDLDIPNKVIVSHSTFICEDFNVSLAQAQNRGWPSLISSFGANTEAMPVNALEFPWTMVGRSDESLDLVKIKSEILADLVIRAF
jgi:hypothetical protein